MIVARERMVLPAVFAALLALLVGVVLVNPPGASPGGGSSAAGIGSGTGLPDEPASAPPPTSAPARTSPTAPAAPAPQDVLDAEQPFGWGAAQPRLMRATVRHGQSSEPSTIERKELLGSLLQQARTFALDIGTVAEAERRGFQKNWEYVDGRGYEYINWDNFTAEFDIEKPGMLVFPDDAPDSRVISMAYNVLGTQEAGPPDALPLENIPWHYHTNLCRVGDSVVGSVEIGPDGEPYQDQAERCESLGASYLPELDHWMVDLWVVPGWENPWGLVSSRHPDMYKEPEPWLAHPASEEVPAWCDLSPPTSPN